LSVDSPERTPFNARMRSITRQELSHERLGDSFQESLSDYDTGRRVEVLVRAFLSENIVRERVALDVGCGLGFFSAALQQRGAIVSACDIGPSLVERTGKLAGCPAQVADRWNYRNTLPGKVLT